MPTSRCGAIRHRQDRDARAGADRRPRRSRGARFAPVLRLARVEAGQRGEDCEVASRQSSALVAAPPASFEVSPPRVRHASPRSSSHHRGRGHRAAGPGNAGRVRTRDLRRLRRDTLHTTIEGLRRGGRAAPRARWATARSATWTIGAGRRLWYDVFLPGLARVNRSIEDGSLLREPGPCVAACERGQPRPPDLASAARGVHRHRTRAWRSFGSREKAFGIHAFTPERARLYRRPRPVASTGRCSRWSRIRSRSVGRSTYANGRDRDMERAEGL